MINVPSFLIKRIYVKGSLRNTSQGFQFELKNTLGSGYGTELMPLMLDGRELPVSDSSFVLDGEETSFAAVSQERPFTLPMNKTLTVVCRNVTLTRGPHRLGFNFVVQGLGRLSFEVADMVGDT